jgi:hypothetical protein
MGNEGIKDEGMHNQDVLEESMRQQERRNEDPDSYSKNWNLNMNPLVYHSQEGLDNQRNGDVQ